ncbi:UNVERIFIED_CONTAM: hypothetical protein GTU68_062081 [Idotea baltica]|nr:hypothetical protein [Idotea baltica]
MGQFDAPGDLKGYAFKYNGQGITLYVTNDGHAVLGTLLDAKGKDLSEAPLEKLVYKPLGQEMWASLEKSTWIADGKSTAKHIVYVFTDPHCPYCTAFWKSAGPWVDSGKVQLRHILVGILRPDSAGKAAALLAAKNPKQALHDYEESNSKDDFKPLSEIPKDLEKKLADNVALMTKLGSQATPAIFYMDDHNRLQHYQGAPTKKQLINIMEGKTL